MDSKTYLDNVFETFYIDIDADVKYSPEAKKNPKDVPIAKNPNQTEWNKILKDKRSKSESNKLFRGIRLGVDRVTKDLYVWPGGIFHDEIVYMFKKMKDLNFQFKWQASWDDTETDHLWSEYINSMVGQHKDIAKFYTKKLPWLGLKGIKNWNMKLSKKEKAPLKYGVDFSKYVKVKEVPQQADSSRIMQMFHGESNMKSYHKYLNEKINSFSENITKKYNLTQVKNSVGFSEKEQKWYGWSHRAVCAFGIGDKIFEEKFGDDNTPFIKHGNKSIKTLADAKLAAKRFSEYVS